MKMSVFYTHAVKWKMADPAWLVAYRENGMMWGCNMVGDGASF